MIATGAFGAGAGEQLLLMSAFVLKKRKIIYRG
jgi:hypothetical protein